MRRVLAPDGIAMIEAIAGYEEGVRPGFWEACAWPTISVLIAIFEAQALALVDRTPITEPWPGERMTFRLRH